MISQTRTPAIAMMMAKLEADLQAGKRVTVKDIALEMGMKVIHVRSNLVAQYGDRIRFKRGRTGGIDLLP
jgi:hypothetical protein